MKKALVVLLGMSFLNFYSQNVIQFGEVTKLDEKVNTISEEIMPLISSDGKTFYFVRARAEENEGGSETGHDIWKSEIKSGDFQDATNKLGKLNNIGNNAVVGISKNNEHIYLLNAYKTESKEEKGVALTDDNYSKPTFVEIDGMVYSSQFYGFYVNPEETVLFISMEGPNSNGEEDLYVSTNNGGNWSQPIKLGGSINSSGYEISPFLSRDGKRLYFSSNGHGGEGSADIFYSERTGVNWLSWGDPINLGPNVNSSGFDAYFTESIDSTAYFASTRESENSDIYRLKINWEEPTVVEVIEVIEAIKDIVEVISDNPPLPDPHVSNIYFDNDKFNIRKDALENLNYLVKVMKEMPNLLVTIEGHADNNYTDTYNQKLSADRSKAAKKHLTNTGIDASRITFVAFGESKPAASCDNCSEEQLQLNRRVEFVLSWKE
jgi:outer membrane protein OmpA-like peptidoglycan-associated protein